MIHVASGQKYAAKLIRNVFYDEYHARKVVREIEILRALSKDPNNMHTTKLIELVIPFKDRAKQDFDDIFIIMDYQNLDLKKLVKSVGSGT